MKEIVSSSLSKKLRKKKRKRKSEFVRYWSMLEPESYAKQMIASTDKREASNGQQ
jgi:hypothetical protein